MRGVRTLLHPSKSMRAPLAVLTALSLGTPCLAAQGTADFVPPSAQDREFTLSIRSIMRGSELVGSAPAALRWTDDARWLYFRWKRGGEAWDARTSLYRVPSAGGEPERLDDDAAREAEPLIAGGDLSPDRRWRVSAVDGDLYVVNRRAMTFRRLTHTGDVERSPLFGPEGRTVLFRRGDNVFRINLRDGALDQVTHLASGPGPKKEADAEGQRAFLEEQQFELFEHVRREKAIEDTRDALREAAEAGEPETTYLAPGERVGDLATTRDGHHVLVSATKAAREAETVEVPNWVTEDGYTRELKTRSKVGDEQAATRVGLLTTETGAMQWLDVTPEGYEQEGAPRVFNTGWNEDGTVGFVFASSFDNEERWLWAVDAASGTLTLLDHLHDDAWVGGPCFARCVGFLPGTNRVWFVSEETGYAHLYSIAADGSDRRTLTSGAWEVLDVDVPEGMSRFLLTTNEGSPFNQHVVWMDFDGGDRTPVTTGDGRYTATPSPDGRRLALVHDVANRPPELYLAETRRPDRRTRITDSPTDEWSSFPWIKPEIVSFAAEDGTMVPARIYRPRDVGAEPNGAGIIFVHGAGYLHNVHNYWSTYFREYMFNHFLAANGYTVLDVDYRGSAGYGRDWRTAIYRWMGGKDLSDQVDGARYLVAQEGVDADRVGMYGGSYGGFITLMALFTADDTFKAGAALRSVTDWAHYNHPYTANILNLPQDDREAYERSSPIYFAEGLGPDQHLLMLHGMVDTNVHFSDVVRLSQRLIELGKENWELAVYPVESHGFVEPTSWTDEYRRIFELFERTLR